MPRFCGCRRADTRRPRRARLIERSRGHSYVDGPTAGEYMLSLIDRGADLLSAAGRVDLRTADALKAEARHRSTDGRFFAHIAYGSLISRKPAA